MYLLLDAIDDVLVQHISCWWRRTCNLNRNKVLTDQFPLLREVSATKDYLDTWSDDGAYGGFHTKIE